MSNEALILIFKEVLSITDESEIKLAALGGTKGWDSFSHMKLIVEIEERFNIDPIPPKQIVKLTSFNAFSEYLGGFTAKG